LRGTVLRATKGGITALDGQRRGKRRETKGRHGRQHRIRRHEGISSRRNIQSARAATPTAPRSASIETPRAAAPLLAVVEEL
jgi:hypothetical protein